VPITVLTLAALVVVAYAVGVLMTRGKIPRGTSIGGIDVGGKTITQAKALVRAGLEPKATAGIPVTAGPVTTTIQPAAAGLTLDVNRSVDQLGTTSMSPSSILHGFHRGTAHRAILVENDTTLATTVAGIAAKVDLPVREGSVHYNGVTPVAVNPQIGRALDQTKSVALILARFTSLTGSQATIALPVITTQPKTSQAQIDTALTTLAAPAVAGPLHLSYAGTSVDVPAATLASVLTLAAGPDGSIQATADEAKVAATFLPLLGTLPAVTPKDAKIALVDDKPHITPSVSATTPDPVALALAVPKAVVDPSRTLVVPVKTTDPAFTTADAEKLGIKAIVGAEDPNDGATPHPCCAPRVHNLDLITGIVNNAIILPGQVFSLNQYVGQRTTARGFVLAPEISGGAEKQAVGGGVSQFATTMFNAAYFSGMKIIEHHPHSFWISRYPPGREATVSWPSPDLKWQNNTPYGVLVQAWDDGTHTHVRFWSTPYWDVNWSSSAETHQTTPATTYETPDEISGKQVCVPTVAETGFDITIYRTDSHAGVSQPQESWFHRYTAQPLHICKPNPTLSPSPGASLSPGAPGSPTATPKPGSSPGTSPTPKPTTTPTPTKPSLTPTPKA
jgi:vancomycin resistance protein YoaR